MVSLLSHTSLRRQGNRLYTVLQHRVHEFVTYKTGLLEVALFCLLCERNSRTLLCDCLGWRALCSLLGNHTVRSDELRAFFTTFVMAVIDMTIRTTGITALNMRRSNITICLLACFLPCEDTGRVFASHVHILYEMYGSFILASKDA